MAVNYWRHWDEKFLRKEWGRYPPEDLVRFMGRRFRNLQNRESVHVLEIGSGTGANLWFLHREGFQVAGIDGSTTGVEITKKRLETENAMLNNNQADIVVGNFERLPWADNKFDVIVDVFAIYANPIEVISRTLAEAKRVLKPGGVMYSKLWGKQTTGYGQGAHLENDTYDKIPCGPLFDMGVSTFFDKQTAKQYFGVIGDVQIDTLQRTDGHAIIEELMVCCQG